MQVDILVRCDVPVSSSNPSFRDLNASVVNALSLSPEIHRIISIVTSPVAQGPDIRNRSTVCESYNHDKCADNDCGCECHTKSAPSPSTFLAVTDFLVAAGLDAHLEGGGAGCAYVEIHHKGSYYAVGDVNENWGMDEYTSYASWEKGHDPAASHDLGVASSSNDAQAIADAVVEVVLNA